jgi:acrylyl-CoA reductase (NADPH)
VPMTIVPFLLRGVNLLGINSVFVPYAARVAAWNRLLTDMPQDKLRPMIRMVGLSDLPALGAAILQGQVQGRVVVDLQR